MSTLKILLTLARRFGEVGVLVGIMEILVHQKPDLMSPVEGLGGAQFPPSTSKPGAPISPPRPAQHFLCKVSSPKFAGLIKGGLNIAIWDDERDMQPGDTILFQEKTSKNTALRQITAVEHRVERDHPLKWLHLCPNSKVDVVHTSKEASK